MHAVSVGGIAVQPFQSMDEVVDYILQNGQIRTGYAVAINPEKVMQAKNDPQMKALIDQASLRFADGIGVVKTIRKKGVPNARIPGCELWQALMTQSIVHKIPVMLVGARPEVNKEVQERLVAAGVNVVFACDGYALDEEKLVQALHEHQPRLVSVALGSPKQEKLMVRLQQRYANAFYQGVGGTFDVYAGAVKRAPQWACKLNIEWLYRLCCEPRRIFRQRNLVKYLVADITGKL